MIFGHLITLKLIMLTHSMTKLLKQLSPIKSVTSLSFFLLMSSHSVEAQDKLYNDQFSLEDITLLSGKFNDAMNLNVEVLMKYDMDRLLYPYYRESGMDNGAKDFPNWSGLSGHVGGHYLSALAIHYAAVKDPVTKEMIKNRLDQMLKELKICQDASANLGEHMVGHLGGIPGSSNIWKNFKNGNFSAYNSAWVGWYNIHKTFAGLRDAYLYGGSEEAKEIGRAHV